MNIYDTNCIIVDGFEKVLCFDSIFFSEYANESAQHYACIEDGKVTFKSSETNSKSRTFDRWLKDIKLNGVDERNNPSKSYTFKNIISRLSSKCKVSHRKNADLREFRYFKGFYMVKTYFSFGFRTVQRNVQHLFKTTNKTLDFFFAKKQLFKEDGAFEENLDYLFVKYTLAPYKTLILDPGTQYIMVAPSKSIFYFTDEYTKEELLPHYINNPVIQTADIPQYNIISDEKNIHFNVKKEEFVIPDQKNDYIEMDFKALCCS